VTNPPRPGGARSQQLDLGADFRTSDNGLLIGSVRANSFLANAGIREGDQIVLVNGRELAGQDFRDLISTAQGRVQVTVVRDGQRQEITLNLDEMNRAPGGTNLQESKAALGIWFHSSPDGARVVHVVPGSPAEQAGIRRGDSVVGMNGQSWSDWQAVVSGVGQAEPESTADLQIRRNGGLIRTRVRLAGYGDVFSDSQNWQTIATQYGYDDQDQGVQPEPSGPQSSQPNLRDLERRLREVEQATQDLRRQIERHRSTGDEGRTADPE
jgi:S1-C subfamily serine protease